MDQFSRDTEFDAAADDAGQPRPRARDSLFLAATLYLDGHDPAAVRVRNLSPGGLMAEFPDPVSIGTDAAVEVRGIGKVPGKVAWVAEGRIGIAFDREIDPKAARKPVGAGTKTPSFLKPILPRR